MRGAPIAVAASMAAERGLRLTWTVGGGGDPAGPGCLVAQQSPAAGEPVRDGVLSVLFVCRSTN
jgi:hypothetical protein